MKMKLVSALVLGAALGAGGAFGFVYNREMHRYRAYQKRMAEQPAVYPLAIFNIEELYALKLVDPSGGGGKSIRDSASRVAVINLWGSWCKPCIDEFASFERLQERSKDRVDFYFLTGDPPETMVAIASRFKLPFYSYGSDRSLPPYLLGLGILPRTYIIRDGRIVFERQGDAPWDSAQAVALLEAVIAGEGR